MARAYDCLLGGEHNFASDRAMIRQAMEFIPDLPIPAQANRGFLHRAVSFLTASGIRHFLDIGSGIPTRGNVHEVAQKAASDAKVVYVDIHPVAVSHSRQLLAGNTDTAVIREGARNAAEIVAHPDVRALLDFDRPVALLMVALLHVIPDSDDPYGMVTTLRSVMAPGSYLVIGHGTADGRAVDTDRFTEISRQTPTTLNVRDRAGVLRFFDGFEPERSSNYVGVGRLA